MSFSYGGGGERSTEVNDLPRYFLVGERPVQFVATRDGGMDVLAYDWQTGEFVREMRYLTRCSAGDPEVDEVDEATFFAAVARHRASGVRD